MIEFDYQGSHNLLVSELNEYYSEGFLLFLG